MIMHTGDFTKILLIDDSDSVGLLIQHELQQDHNVSQVFSIDEAEKIMKEKQFQLLLIDVNLPGGNGFDLCHRLSLDVVHRKTPKILLTSLDDISKKVFGFNCGADDYITKPFHPIELKARINRFLKDTNSPTGAIYSHPQFLFNLEFQKCFAVNEKNNIDLDLTPTEFRLFLTLVKNEGRVLSRKDLEKATWESQGVKIQKRGIDAHVTHIRKKLGSLKTTISAIYGQGYSFQAKVG